MREHWKSLYLAELRSEVRSVKVMLTGPSGESEDVIVAASSGGMRPSPSWLKTKDATEIFKAIKAGEQSGSTSSGVKWNVV